MTRRLELFATEYDVLIQRILDTKQDVVVTAATEKEASRIKWRFYQYRKLLKKSENSDRREFGRLADFIMVNMTGKVVKFQDRRFSRESILLREALSALPPAEEGANPGAAAGNNPGVGTVQTTGSSPPPDTHLPIGQGTGTDAQEKAIKDLYGTQEDDE